MRKLSLAAIGMYLGILSAFSQTDSAYKNKKLKTSEINFVTSYYRQNGNLSPVTGGIGTQKLSDFATTIEIRMNRYDKKNRKHEVGFELGVDNYTSASSDQIDPHTTSSASHSDLRVYPTLSYGITNESKGSGVHFNASYSNEYDYNSIGGGIGLTKSSKDKNTDFSIKLQAYLDKLKLIYPIEMRGPGMKEGWTGRDSYSGSLGFSQVINTRMQFALMLDLIYQSGYLSTPFHRIYFNNGTKGIEKLPSTRIKIPIGMRLNYFVGDEVIIRSYYRYYHDDWGLNAHTVQIEVPVKLTPNFSISPFFRYYTQNAVKYFAPYQGHLVTESFYTTDDDLSKFNSKSEGVGFRFAQPEGIFGIKKLNTLDLRYAHYNRNIGLNSDIITLALKFK